LTLFYGTIVNNNLGDLCDPIAIGTLCPL